MARLAEPLISGGSTLFCMSYFGADRGVHRYGVSVIA
jgi:enoyl-[acyl-carrier-protein] reductase (NADH)